jgi:putative phosphoesterase
MTSNVAVISDIHGVLPALERVLAEPVVAEAELIVVAGDHTWGPQPAEVLDRLVALGDRAVLVRGNADRELLHAARALDAGSASDLLTIWGADQLTAHHLELLERMPEQVTIDVDGFGPVRFCHATPRSDEEVVLVDTRVERWVEAIADLPDDVRTLVCGHTHMPFVRLVGGRLVVNPGSVGLPYGRSGAHWAYLSEGTVSLGRTVIDPDALIDQIVAASRFPDIRQWVDDYLRSPAGDIEAIAAFGPRDGRLAPEEGKK